MVDWSTSSPRHTANWKRGIAAFVIGIVILQSHPIKASRKPDFLGCYKHETDKWQFKWGPPGKVNYTITNCFRECEKNGFEKAGLMNGSMCRCTNKPLGASGLCNVQCYENWESLCGGKNSLSVYRAPEDAKDRRYIGCWSRKGGPVLEELPDSQVATTDLTSCIANCRKNSKQDPEDGLVAALNKTHCVCGLDLNNKSQPAEVEACVAGSESEQLFDIYTPDCPEGTYDKICSPCRCSGDEVCDLATGSCPGACADGWLKDPVACSKVCEPGTYGNQCSQQCFCEDSKACDPQTGSCPTQSCMPGFTGSTCSQECTSGFFGFNCSDTCKCFNGTDCNHVNGTCLLGLCLAGWTGPDCQSKVIMALTEAEVLSTEKSASSWGTHAAGGGAGGFIALFVVVVAVLCFIRHRRNHNRKMKAHQARMRQIRVNSSTSLLNDTTKTSSVDQRDTNSFYSTPSAGGSPGVTSSPKSPGKPLRFCMTAGEFIEYFQRRRLGNEALAAEFSILGRGPSHSTKEADSNPNKKIYNRSHVLPFDHNRVKLQEEGETESDYINASYIKSYDGMDNFIATEAPTQETVCNFWRMIWSCNVRYIIMLTRLIESGRNKCTRYWPVIQDIPAVYDNHLTVIMRSEDHWPDFIIRKFTIAKGRQEREVNHYQFTGWPDMGVPRHTMPFIVFMQLVRSQRLASSGRTVVHCSTATGRTGIFLATDILCDQLALREEVDVPSCIQNLREQRRNVVQTLDQYSFIYLIIYESLTLGTTRLLAEEFPEKYAKLKEGYPGIIEKQFKNLELLADAASVTHNDSGRGSVSDFLTVSETRPISQSSVLSISQYIPVNGYASQNAFLISRFPGLNDPTEFWSTVHDNNSRIVVSFTHKNCCWPSIKGCTENYGAFNVTCVGQSAISTSTTPIKHTVLEIVSLEVDGAKRFVDAYEAPIDEPISFDILDLHTRLQSAKDVTGSKSPIVIHNSSNYQIAGVLCALNVIMEMLDLEKEVDIFLAVRRVRAAVPFFIDTVEIYQHLHDVTAYYINGLSQPY